MLRISFHIIHILLLVNYLYPASIIGCLFYNDCAIQPDITNDFGISSNHFFAFLLFGLISFYSYPKKLNKITIYVLTLSIILEFAHLIIPNREFEIKDLFGNVFGVIISFIIHSILKKINLGGKNQ